MGVVGAGVQFVLGLVDDGDDAVEVAELFVAERGVLGLGGGFGVGLAVESVGVGLGLFGVGAFDHDCAVGGGSAGPDAGGVVAELAVDGVGEGLGVFAEVAASALECAVFGGLAPGLVGEVAAELFGVVAVLFDELEGVPGEVLVVGVDEACLFDVDGAVAEALEEVLGEFEDADGLVEAVAVEAEELCEGGDADAAADGALEGVGAFDGVEGEALFVFGEGEEDVAGGVRGVEGGLGGDEDGDVAELGVDGGLSAAFADDEAELSVGCGLGDDGLEEAVGADGVGEFLDVGEGDVVAWVVLRGEQVLGREVAEFEAAVEGVGGVVAGFLGSAVGGLGLLGSGLSAACLGLFEGVEGALASGVGFGVVFEGDDGHWGMVRVFCGGGAAAGEGVWRGLQSAGVGFGASGVGLERESGPWLRC